MSGEEFKEKRAEEIAKACKLGIEKDGLSRFTEVFLTNHYPHLQASHDWTAAGVEALVRDKNLETMQKEIFNKKSYPIKK